MAKHRRYSASIPYLAEAFFYLFLSDFGGILGLLLSRLLTSEQDER